MDGSWDISEKSLSLQAEGESDVAGPAWEYAKKSWFLNKK